MAERTLEQIAVSIRGHYESGVAGYQAAFEAKLAMGADLYEARRKLSSDKLFGKWIQAQQFGFSTRWAWLLVQASKQERQLRLLGTQVLGNGEEPNFKQMVSAIRNGVHYSSETPEWYTPTEIIERVTKVSRMRFEKVANDLSLVGREVVQNSTDLLVRPGTALPLR